MGIPPDGPTMWMVHAARGCGSVEEAAEAGMDGLVPV